MAQKKNSLYRPIKRLLDLIFSGLALLVLSPVLALIALLIFVTQGRPILFTQDRPGKDGKIFKLYKFRTMDVSKSQDLGSVAQLKSDAERLTPLGEFLRKSSLDELPELFNVFIGDMSFVGPRPLLVEYLELYSPEQARRHELRPGITGLAQVSGRNLLSWPARFALDVEYVDSLSFWLDFKILLRTLLVVFKGTGVSAEGEVSSAPFEGER